MNRYYWADRTGGVVYEAKGGGGATLGDVWRHLTGCGNVAILREMAGGHLEVIARRGMGGRWELAG